MLGAAAGEGVQQVSKGSGEGGNQDIRNSVNNRV